jgi:hypothetical protein
MISTDQFTRSGRRVVDMRQAARRGGSSTPDEILGTIELYKVIAARAYWLEDGEGYSAGDLVPPGTAYSASTMDLKKTWDWVRAANIPE